MKHLFTFLFIFCFAGAFAQRTVGLVQYDVPNTDGYVLFAPMQSTKTFLIDKCGEKIHEWNSAYKAGLSCYLLEDGSLLRCGNVGNPNFTAGGNGGVIEKYNWSGTLTWSYALSDSDHCQHHDVHALPNGNVLAIVWERHAGAEAIANGKNPATTNAFLWSEKIVELQPVGTNGANVVWEWRLWDHLVQDFDAAKPNYGVVSEHPELVDINYVSGPPTSFDWIHMNSIDYNPTLDQILVSSHNLDEFWIIDHSTTTAQATSHQGGNSGKGGDVLYRWGNPQTYDRGNNTTQKLFGQHHATWVPTGYPNAGKILVFNNGFNRPAGDYSSIEMIDPPINGNNYNIDATAAFGPTEAFWTYTASTPTDFYANNISGVYPLIDGSFMITNGPSGYFFEIDSNANTVWKYINPVGNNTASQGSTPTQNLLFRANFYPTDYPAFAGQTLTQLGELELNPLLPSICDSLATTIYETVGQNEIAVYPNPVAETLYINANGLSTYKVEVVNAVGETVLEASNKSRLDVSKLGSGLYFVKLTQRDAAYSLKVLKL